jgi:tetratricopeptide (TPR) repeat protein
MEPQANGSLRLVMTGIALAASLSLSATVLAQGALQPNQSASNEGTSRAGNRNAEEAPPPTNIDVQTGKILNEAIGLMTAENYTGAQQKLGTLKMENLSPYEAGKVYQILFNISYSQDRYDEARQNLQKAIDSGGLNAVEVDGARYQAAQLYMQEEKWREGAAALEEWFKSTPTTPNSSAYYLLAVAYYQQDDYNRALPPAKKAVELMTTPNENWLQLVSALHLQREEFRESIPILQQLVTVAPDKKTYWMQLSSVYGQMEDYGNALAIMQLANSAGLVTEDSEVRRLADLLLFNEVPYRCGQVLEAGIEKKLVNADEKLYEKLANCWIAANEYEKAISPLERAAGLAATGDLFVRLGEVHAQRDDWPAAVSAIQRGVDKGGLKDPGNAQLWLGIAHYTQKKYSEARPFFERARQTDKYRNSADSYLQAIRAQS